MSEHDEYTPTMDDLVDGYAYCTGIGPVIGERRRAIAKRAIAAHDKALRRKWMQEATEDVIAHDEALEKALREQIADDLRIEALNEDTDIPDTYREGIRDGLMRGVDIARGEDQTDE